MAKATTKLNAPDRVILFSAGIEHGAVGILARAMQSMGLAGCPERIPGTSREVAGPMVRRDRLTRSSHPRQTVFWGLPSGGDGAEIATARDLGRIPLAANRRK